MEKKQMKDLVGTITSEGKVIPFSQYLKDMSGTGALYDSNIGDIINAALSADESQWDAVDDILGPIAHEVLTEAVQTDQQVYLELVTAIKTAHEKLAARHTLEQNADEEFIINEQTTDLFAVIKHMLSQLNSGRVIKEFTANAHADYRVVIGSKAEGIEHEEDR